MKPKAAKKPLKIFFISTFLMFAGTLMSDASQKNNTNTTNSHKDEKPSAGLFNPKVKELANGLKVVVVTNKLSPTVAVGVLYNVGTADDPMDKMGLSHFLEHMMFKGTKTVPSDRFKKIIFESGGETNAGTSYDFTLYYTSVPKEKMETILTLEADRMCNLAFSEQEVVAEREVVMEERRMRIENDSMGPAHEIFMKSCFWYHPYGILPIGYPQHINNYTYDSVHDHYQKWYVPNNATVVIVGDTDIETALPLIEKHFGHIKRKETPKRQRQEELDHKGIVSHIKQTHKRHPNIILCRSYGAINYRGNLDKKNIYYALTVLSHIMGGSETTAFYKDFIKQKRLALQVSTLFEDATYDPKSFEVTAILAPDANIENFNKNLDEYIEVLTKAADGKQNDPFAQQLAEEVEKAKKELIDAAAFVTDGNLSILYQYAQLASGIEIEEMESYEQRIKAVTVKDVIEAANLIFGKKPLATMELHPE